MLCFKSFSCHAFMSFHSRPRLHPLTLLNIWFQLPALRVWPGKWSPLDQRQLEQTPERQPLAQCHNLQGHQQPPHRQDWYQGHDADDDGSQKPGPEGCVGIVNLYFFIKLGRRWPRGEGSRFVTERFAPAGETLEGWRGKKTMLGPHSLPPLRYPWAKNRTIVCSVANTNAVHAERGVHRKDYLCLAD